MRLLLVLAHPLTDSFAAAVATTARRALETAGHEVDWLDLYREDFDPRLTASERSRYFDAPYDLGTVAPLVERVRATQGLVLVFPQWWFNFPAILKGFFDRVLAPGVAFELDLEGGRIVPKLGHIRVFWAFTTTGSPWWVVKLYMGNPVRKLLRRSIVETCSNRVDFRMLALHDMDRAGDRERRAHLAKVERLCTGLRG